MSLEFKPCSYSGLEVYFDGQKIPHLEALRDESNDSISLLLDGRFAVSLPSQNQQNIVWFIANAMAVAAGQSCFGEHCQALNPYKKFTELPTTVNE